MYERMGYTSYKDDLMFYSLCILILFGQGNYIFFLDNLTLSLANLELDNKSTRKLLTTDPQQFTNNVDREIPLSNWFDLLPISLSFRDGIANRRYSISI